MRRLLPWSGRRPARRATDIPCQAVRFSDFRLVADRIVDLSPSGMRVTPAEAVLTGETLIVSFRTPRWGRWVDLEAIVTRVQHGRRAGDGARSLGLEFEFLDAHGRFVLEQSLAWMPPVPPRPRPGRRATAPRLERLLRGPVHVPSVNAP
jgi:hypothetical protein